MSKDPVFLILKPMIGWLPEKDWIEILGAAVKNPWSPIDDYAPRSAWAYNKNPLVEDSYDGFVLQKDKTSSHSFEVEAKGLGKLRWGKSTGHQIDLRGKKIYIKRLRRHSEMWKELSTKSEDFQEEVPGWVNDKRWGRAKYRVCLVVGLLICQDVIVAASDEEVRDRKASGGVPLGTISEFVSASQGVPISTSGVGDVSTEVSNSVINRTYFEAEGTGKRIFALELKIISSNKDKLVLTDKTPESSRHLGPDDDEVEPNDLLMRDIEPKEWDEILQDEEA